MTRTTRLGVALLAVLLSLGTSAFSAPPAASRLEPTIVSIAAQLGVKVVNHPDEEFVLGKSFTGTLEKPAKLAALGIPFMAKGARVAAARVAQDRVIVEADQLEPARRETVKLGLDAAGKLVGPPKA